MEHARGEAEGVRADNDARGIGALQGLRGSEGVLGVSLRAVEAGRAGGTGAYRDQRALPRPHQRRRSAAADNERADDGALPVAAGDTRRWSEGTERSLPRSTGAAEPAAGRHRHRPAHRLREHRQPPAGARRGAGGRNERAARHRREPLAARRPAAVGRACSRAAAPPVLVARWTHSMASCRSCPPTAARCIRPRSHGRVVYGWSPSPASLRPLSGRPQHAARSHRRLEGRRPNRREQGSEALPCDAAWFKHVMALLVSAGLFGLFNVAREPRRRSTASRPAVSNTSPATAASRQFYERLEDELPPSRRDRRRRLHRRAAGGQQLGQQCECRVPGRATRTECFQRIGPGCFFNTGHPCSPAAFTRADAADAESRNRQGVCQSSISAVTLGKRMSGGGASSTSKSSGPGREIQPGQRRDSAGVRPATRPQARCESAGREPGDAARQVRENVFIDRFISVLSAALPARLARGDWVTASSPTRSRSARGKSGCAWRSAPRRAGSSA